MALVSYVSLEENFTQSLGLAAPAFSTGQAASLFTSFNFLFTMGITVVVVVGAGALAYAGWQRIQPSEQAVTKSNKMAKRAVLGTLGVVSLYVLLRTFNADLVTGNVGLDALRGSRPITVPQSTQPASPPPVTTNASETANRQSLAAAGISINKPACTPAQMSEPKPSCTNVASLQPAVMSMLIQLKDSCPGSSITITGGTEPGHKSHGGGRAVDIRIGDTALDTCIKKFNTGPTLGFCNLTRTGIGGFVFCDERNVAQPHWHVYY